MRDEILNYILDNRVSSVEVSDALGKQGVLDGVAPLNPGHFIAAPVHYVATWHETNWPLHAQVANVPENVVVYVDAIHCARRAVLGDVVSKYLCLYRRATGIVTNGLVRDAHRLHKEDYPIWCAGTTPLGCYNRDISADDVIRAAIMEAKTKFHGAILVCDDSGCAIIEAQHQTKEFLKHLEFTELQEDIWYFCIDTLKLSTYDTICRKRYLEDTAILPSNLRTKLEQQDDS